MKRVLHTDFYERDPVTVARELLGQKLVREHSGQRLTGIITETEAYLAFTDSASHAFRGRTERNSVMFGPPGFAYVYFIYGMHYMLNVVTESEGMPSAVLIRGIRPVNGVAEMTRLRNTNSKNLTNGPARLCQALAIDKSLNAWCLTAGKTLWIEAHASNSSPEIMHGPRVGIDYAEESDRKKPLRFWIEDRG
ncbi:DNA-3-methyladenine glycosylase [bacterium]|nr:DNA-3-methyladenine glycosylase [bacterium]